MYKNALLLNCYSLRRMHKWSRLSSGPRVGTFKLLLHSNKLLSLPISLGCDLDSLNFPKQQTTPTEDSLGENAIYNQLCKGKLSTSQFWLSFNFSIQVILLLYGTTVAIFLLVNLCSLLDNIFLFLSFLIISRQNFLLHYLPPPNILFSNGREWT